MSAPTASSTRTRPLRLRLLLLAATGLLPLVLLSGWGITHLVDEREVVAQRSVLELSRALATAVDAELRSTVALLDQMGTSDDLERADLRSFHQAARRSAEQLGWLQVALSDGEGRVLLRTGEPFGSSNPTPVDPLSMADVLARHVPIVGAVESKPEFTSNTFRVRVPVMRSGKVVYVLSALLPVEKVLRVLTRQDIPPGSVASVFDQTQHRVARSRQVASPYPHPTLKALLDTGNAQGTGRTLTRDGIENFTGFTRLKDWGWYVTVGTSVEQVNAGLYALLRAVAMGVAASLTLSVLLAFVLSRQVLGPIDKLKDGAAALGRGDPVDLPPLDIVELDGVAVALTEAAAHRDRATQERERLTSQVTEALRAAEDANSSKDQFLAMLGHELRNPLAPISTAVQIMALKGDEKTAHERRIIERQLVHVTRLVDDLLDVSRITTNRLTITKRPVRIAAVLTQVVETIQPSLYKRFLSLELAPEVDDAWVAGDEVRLVQVFNNLLVNAIKFTPPGGSIRVQARLAGDEDVCIDVQDSGIGIPADDLHKIFGLFYQAPQTSDRTQGGLGLGLPIVRSLVEMHGGHVSAGSDGVGKGSCFAVVLPLCEIPEHSSAMPIAPLPSGAGNVLVVDDNEDAADTCATLLQLSGYNVQAAYSPQEALDALRGFTPDIAVLDIGLPGMSGYQLAGKLRQAGYRGQLVALTGYGQAADRAMSKQVGFVAHLTKPVLPEVLLDLVSRLVRVDPEIISAP